MRPLGKQVLDDFLEVGEEPGVVHRQPAPQRIAVEQALIEVGLFAVTNLFEPAADDAVDDGLFLVGGQVQAMRGATAQGLAAPTARKDEVDRRKEFSPPEPFDHRKQVIFGGPPYLRQADVGRGFILRPQAGLPRDASARVEQRIEVVAHGQPESQLDRALADADGGDVTALQAHPVGDLLVVADGGREADELDVCRRLDDDLFPDRPSREVVDVMNLVQDDVADLRQPLRLFVDQVAQDLGGHDHHRRARVDGVLAGHEPDVALAVAARVVAKLLVGEGLQRRGVDRPRLGREGAEDRVVRDHGLARAGGRRDEHPLVGFELLDRLDLEGIKRPGERRLKGVDQRPGQVAR